MHNKSFLVLALATTLASQAQEPADPYKKGTATPPVEIAEESPSKFLSIREETFSVPIGDAFELLHTVRTDADEGDGGAAEFREAAEVGFRVRGKVFVAGDRGGVRFPAGKGFVNRSRAVPCAAACGRAWVVRWCRTWFRL